MIKGRQFLSNLSSFNGGGWWIRTTEGIASRFIIRQGGREDDFVLLASRRYDRVYSDGAGKSISGRFAPNRLHQEDFAQAMGIPAEDKYEKRPQGYLPAMFHLLRRISADPIRDQRLLWEMIVFDYLIGNTDAHLKYFSLLYTPDQKKSVWHRHTTSLELWFMRNRRVICHCSSEITIH